MSTVDYSNENLEDITNFLSKIDRLNDLDSAYCEDEEAILYQNVFDITGLEPKLWKNKSGNRSQCYANMFSKLLLAYILKENKQTPFLSQEFIESIKNRKITTFQDFFYDDCGMETSSVLEDIMQQVITLNNYFKCDYEPIDFLNVMEVEYNDGEREEELIKSIISVFPLLESKLEKEKEYESFWGICNYPVLEIDGELELEIIESEVLYEIEEREKVSKTEEGSCILEMSDKIFLHILQSDYLYDSLQWRVSDNNNRKIYYCMITCNDLYGDECYWPMIANERLHRYSYKNIFKLIQLQLKIEEYQNKYLG